MTSRVQRRRQRITFPAGLGGIASPALLDQHQACGISGFGRQLEPPARGQRDGLLWSGNDQRHWSHP